MGEGWGWADHLNRVRGISCTCLVRSQGSIGREWRGGKLEREQRQHADRARHEGGPRLPSTTCADGGESRSSPRRGRGSRPEGPPAQPSPVGGAARLLTPGWRRTCRRKGEEEAGEG